MAALHPPIPMAGISLDTVLSRLLRAKEEDVAGIVSALSGRQRAELALFCYSRGHLHAIGLAIAATCDLHSLMQAAPSNAAGHVLFAQSRERPKPAEPAMNGSRPRVTLAKSASGNSGLANIIARIARDETAECLPA